MPALNDPPFAPFQAQFHRRWNHLRDPHVRTLAWLLDAPDLLDPDAPQWRGRIASLGAADDATRDWLTGLDRAPAALHAWLGLQAQPFMRLGRYAEKLMAFYLQAQGSLVAHGVQVRAGKNDTIGEFDFLLRQGGALVHWEFATKLYLLESSGSGRHADYFVGPNLADSLGVKIRKIMDRQLALSQHPAARQQVGEPVVAAQALVKGWLFYHGAAAPPPDPAGISAAHCRGFWCAQREFDGVAGESFVILPRLSWLPPAKVAADQVLNRPALREQLAAHFRLDASPLLVAALAQHDGCLLEAGRGFIVPDDWQGRAEQRVKRAD